MKKEASVTSRGSEPAGFACQRSLPAAVMGVEGRRRAPSPAALTPQREPRTRKAARHGRSASWGAGFLNLPGFVVANRRWFWLVAGLVCASLLLISRAFSVVVVAHFGLPGKMKATVFELNSLEVAVDDPALAILGRSGDAKGGRAQGRGRGKGGSGGAARNRTTRALPEPDFPVDVVYTWAGDPDEEELKLLERECPRDPGGKQRWRDTGTFEVSVELTIQNMPWVRTIHVVTDGEVPCWLNTTHPKVNMVSHSDFFGEAADVLPVHNVDSINANMPHIDALAEHFIQIEDDMSILKPVSKSDFFSPDGDVRLITSRERYDEMARHVEGLMRRGEWPPAELEGLPNHGIMDHQPMVRRKSWYREVERVWPEWIQRERRLKCRADKPTAGAPKWVLDLVKRIPLPEWLYKTAYRIGEIPILESKSIHGITAVMNMYSVYKTLSSSYRYSDLTFAWGNDKSYGLRKGGHSPVASVKTLEAFFDSLRETRPHSLTLNDDLETMDDDLFIKQQQVMLDFLEEVRPKSKILVNQALCLPS